MAYKPQILDVPDGGTGATTLTGVVTGNGTSAMTASAITQHDVLIGGASNAITSVAPSATSGVPLISQGASSNPTFGTVVVAGGGTGAATLTGVVIGNGTSAMTASAITQHDVLIGGASNAITSVAPSATSGVPLISQGASTNPTFGTVVVAGGGTGATTLTSHGLLVGAGTSAISALSVGSTGTLLNGVTGGNPTFANSTTGSYTFTNTAASTGTVFTVSQTDNTEFNSDAVIMCQNGGSSGGGAYARYAQASARGYAFGIPTGSTNLNINTDSNATVAPNSGTNIWQMTPAGAQSLPLQPGGLFYVHNAITNATGDSTAYQVVFDSQAWQQGSNFNGSTGTYTCPVAGIYSISGMITFNNLSSSFNDGEMNIQGNAGVLSRQLINVAAQQTAANTCSIVFSAINSCAASSTITIAITIKNGTKTVGVTGDSFGIFSYMSIMKIA
jgi:hypothetical protein